MENDSVNQKIANVSELYPIGTRVCNAKIGSVGIVTGRPHTAGVALCVFLPVAYEHGSYEEDVDYLLRVDAVSKRIKGRRTATE